MPGVGAVRALQTCCAPRCAEISFLSSHTHIARVSEIRKARGPLIERTIHVVQGHDSGAWLWCSRDDLVIEAVRKVRGKACAPTVVLFTSPVTDDQGQRGFTACV